MSINKKQIILVLAAGLIPFGATFAWFYITAPPPETEIEAEMIETVDAADQAEMKFTDTQSAYIDIATVVDSKIRRALTEQQLKTLIVEVRDKIKEYENKLKELELREEQFQLVRNMLKDDVEELEKLRVELASTVASIKNERGKLLESRVEIGKTEKDNLIATAAYYDKMDSKAAGQILLTMSKEQDDGTDDAVKILYYMGARTKAKLLAELVGSEPKLAAYFSTRLQEIMERE